MFDSANNIASTAEVLSLLWTICISKSDCTLSNVCSEGLWKWRLTGTNVAHFLSARTKSSYPCEKCVFSL